MLNIVQDVKVQDVISITTDFRFIKTSNVFPLTIALKNALLKGWAFIEVEYLVLICNNTALTKS